MARQDSSDQLPSDQASERGVDVLARARAISNIPAFWVAAAEIVCLALFTGLAPSGNFLTSDNLLSMGVNSSELLLLAVGTTFVLGAGQLDLSNSAILVVSSVVAARVLLALAGTPDEVAAGVYHDVYFAIAVGALAGLLVGVLFGIVNGLIVTKLKMNSFIVTLATLGIGMGLANLMTNGSNIPYLPPQVQSVFGTQTIYGVPQPLILSLAVAGVGWVILRQTRFGAQVVAAGSSPLAVQRAGIDHDSLVIRVFALSGLLSGLAGLFDLTLYGTTAISGHASDNLSAIAAVVIGGTSLFGGFATMGGSVIAAFLPILLVSGLVFLNVGSYYQQLAVGAILIIAVFVDQRRRARLL